MGHQQCPTKNIGRPRPMWASVSRVRSLVHRRHFVRKLHVHSYVAETFIKSLNLTHYAGKLLVDDAVYQRDVQAAVKSRSVSFAFSAGGFLFPYYIGVAANLKDAGILTEKTKISGASAGALLAASIQCGMNADAVTEWCLRLMDDCRRFGTSGRLGAVLRASLERGLPEDAHLLCSGRAYVGVSKAFPVLRPQLISAFDDRSDLVGALLASAHIPFWLNNQLFAKFRGSLYVDGGFTNFIPLVPGTLGVRVCCFPSRQLSQLYRIGISPDTFEPWPHSLPSMVRWALEPVDEATTLFLIERGRSDSSAWIEAMGLREEEDPAGEGQVLAAKEAAANHDRGAGVTGGADS